MASSNALAGTAYVSVDGTTYQLEGELTWDPGLVKRETLVGMDAVHGFKVTPNVPFIEGTFRDNGQLTVADFAQMDDVTVTVQLVNGKLVIGQGMWVTESPQVNSVEATFKVRFEGVDGSVTEN